MSDENGVKAMGQVIQIDEVRPAMSSLSSRTRSAPAGFIEPCLPSPADKPPAGSTGFKRSSTMATGLWPAGAPSASGSSPAGATTGRPGFLLWSRP